jgi:hypothetical protein
LGGLARRAAYLLDKNDDSPRIVVGGAYEFTHKVGDDPGASTLGALAQAYDFMNYDVSLLADEEQQMLNDAGIEPPAPWKTAEEQPVSIIRTSGYTVGFLRFPALPEDTDIPDAMLVEQVTRLVAKTRPEVDLLVGLSSWGAYGEKAYLDQRPDEVPDILLGGGRGMSFVKRFASGDRVLWSRPYPRGKTVTRVSIGQLPEGEDFEWSNDTVSVGSILLDDSIYEHPDVRGIFEKADTK